MKDTLIRVLVGVLLLAGAAWLVSATEWKDVDTPTPARGEALTNPHYAAGKLLRALGGSVSRHSSLDTLPPPQARLVLVSTNWDLFRDRQPRLREWIRQGGHLVIPGYLVSHRSFKDWVPVKSESPLRQASPASAPSRPAERKPRNEDCHVLAEPDEVPASYSDSRDFFVCGAYYSPQYLPVNPAATPTWSLKGERGTEAVRMPFGRGTVTVIGPWAALGNKDLLRGDNAQFMAAALQVRAGATYWFVAEEAREPFVPWLWHQAWAALLLGLLALAVALWRASVRFGPLARPASAHRRSMAEQVRGTAGFLHMHGSQALHLAQLRALHESATRHLRRFAQLGATARTTEIARATGLDANALARAQAERQRNPRVMAADLELMETARRRLDAAQPPLQREPSLSSSPAAVAGASPGGISSLLPPETENTP